jgi:hypothetical protein
MAHSSPIYVAVGDKWWMEDQDTGQYMLTLIQGGLEYIRYRSRQYPNGKILHHHNHEDHLSFLERPFQEAIIAIEKRIKKDN